MDKNIKIESDPNPMPNFDIIPGLGYVKWLGRQVMNVIYFFPLEDTPNTGAAPLLDRHLDETL